MVEWVKIIATALGDATNGVNALLGGVPRYAGHALPPNVTIYNEVDHGYVARGMFTEDSPMASAANPLLVYEHEQSEEDVAAQTQEADATPTIIVACPVLKSDTKDAIRQAKYTLRAVDRALVRLNDSMPYGLTNGVSLVEPVAKRWLAPFAAREATVVQLGIAYTARFRDDLPRG